MPTTFEASIGRRHPSARPKLPLVLVVVVVIAMSIGTAHGETINFAILWNAVGIANITRNLFNTVFLPNLTSYCPASFNGTSFNFFDMPQTRLFNIALAKQQVDQLRSSGCLFAGAFDRTVGLAMYTEAGVPTGVPTPLTGFPTMVVHTDAPLTLQMAATGVLKAITLAFKLPPSGPVAQKFGVVLGTGYSMEELAVVLDAYQGSVLFFKLRLGSEYSVIRALKATGATNLLLASTSTEADSFLSAAYESLMLQPSYRWFLFNVRLVDKNNFAGFKVVSKNITSMEFGPIGTAIQYNLTRSTEIYQFDLLNIWSIYLKKIKCKDTDDINQTYSGMTGDFQLMPNGTVVRTGWRMYFYSGLGTERTRIGNWSDSGAFNFAAPPDRVANTATIINELNKNTFRVVTILKPPFVQYKVGSDNDTTANGTMYDRLEGFAIDMCKRILTNMSIADVSFFLQPDGQYGSQDAQGNWNGIVQTLMQGKADLACASISDTDARREVMKFSDPYLTFQLSILYTKRQENPLLYMFQFMRPFHLYTWLAVVGSVIGLSIVLTVLHRLSRNATAFGLYQTIFYSFASLIQGITGTPPDRPSGQVVIAIYWLFAFVILVAYVTNYAASRTLSRLVNEITSLSTLYSQTEYTYGTLNGTAYLTMLQNSTDSTQQLVYRYINSDPVNRLLPNLSVALNLVANTSFAFIYDSAMNGYYAQTMCNSMSIGGFSIQTAGMGFPNIAEYDTIFNGAINDLISSGYRDRLYNKYFILGTSARPNCKSTTFPDLLRDYIPQEPPLFNTKSGALTLNNTLGIFVINIVGCVLTLLLATVECIYQRCRRWQRRRRLRAQRKRAEMTAAAQKVGLGEEQLESAA